jgi:hypothetical protein
MHSKIGTIDTERQRSLTAALWRNQSYGRHLARNERTGTDDAAESAPILESDFVGHAPGLAGCIEVQLLHFRPVERA